MSFPGYSGYQFVDTLSGEIVGGAASTMHYKSKAQKKAEELDRHLKVYLTRYGNTYQYVGEFHPKDYFQPFPTHWKNPHETPFN